MHDAIARKAGTYLQGAASRGEVLLALGVGHHGNFKERSHVIIKGLDPKATLSHFYENPSAPPMRGTVRLSVEEGFIHKTTRLGVNRLRGGTGAFDATLSQNSAAGMLINQTFREVAHSCILHTARATVSSYYKNNQVSGIKMEDAAR